MSLITKSAIKFTLVGIVLLAMPLLGFCQSHPEDDSARFARAEIRGVVDRFMKAWNRHDAKAFSECFSEEADFTNVKGVSGHGREQIEQFHAPLFAGVFKNSHLNAEEVKVRFIKPDVAEADVHWSMTGLTSKDGSPRPGRKGLLDFVMVKQKTEWAIVVMHNTELETPFEKK